MGVFFSKYTLHGEVVTGPDGVGGALSLPPLHPDFAQPNAMQVSCLSGMLEAIRSIENKTWNRNPKIPLMRNEVTSFFGIKAVRKLVDQGLLQERAIPLVRNGDGKSIGARAVVYFTPQGRAFIKEHIDKEYSPRDNYPGAPHSGDLPQPELPSAGTEQAADRVE